MGTPEFSYDISALGGNPYLLPGVEQLVASFVRENVLKPFTFPDGAVWQLVRRWRWPPVSRCVAAWRMDGTRGRGLGRCRLAGPHQLCSPLCPHTSALISAGSLWPHRQGLATTWSRAPWASPLKSRRECWR